MQNQTTTTERNNNQKNHALKFIVLLGIVSLFADVTYEGAQHKWSVSGYTWSKRNNRWNCRRIWRINRTQPAAYFRIYQRQNRKILGNNIVWLFLEYDRSTSACSCRTLGNCGSSYNYGTHRKGNTNPRHAMQCFLMQPRRLEGERVLDCTKR